MTNDIQVVMVETNKIKPYHRNARVNDEAVAKLVEAIPLVGFNQPIVIDRNNVIVKGHSRWKAAIRLGLEKVPCIITDNDEELNKLDRLTDNKIHEYSTWDEGILATELASINLDGLELSDFGFDLIEEPTEYVQEAVAPKVEGFEKEPPKYVPQYMEQEITEDDVRKTYIKDEVNYGHVVCPNCGQVVLYKR